MRASHRQLVSLALVAAACDAAQEPRPLARHNVLLVTVDTLRADRVGTGLTPAIDEVAAQGLRFVNARTVAPLTLPAHVSIMTGQMPFEHGVRLNGISRATGERTVAQRLRAAGYRTAAVVGAFVLDRRFGLAEGFDEYDDRIARDPSATDRLEAERPANVVVDRAIALLASGDGSKPWFLWVHLYDPHAPYAAPRAAAGRTAYDAEVAFADAELGRLLQVVRSRPDAMNTAIVIAGDHGEGLGEHGESAHGMLLFDSTLRVPLIVSAPGKAAATRSEPVSLADVGPTLLALAGLPPGDGVAGRSLLEPADAEREIYAETDYPESAGWHPGRALVQDRFKLIASGPVRLFDVAADPSETHDLASDRTQAAAAMAARLDRFAAGRPGVQPATGAPDAETAARLRALGYVSAGSRPAAPGPRPDPAAHTADWAAFERALSADSRGDAREAAAILESLWQRHRESPLFGSAYARALAAAGRARDALAVLRLLVDRSPADASLVHDLAVIARDAGRPDEALSAERAALAIDSRLPAAHNGLGLLLADRGDHAGAAASFEAATTHDSTNGTYWTNLGNARRALGDLDAARRAYDAALARDGSLADAANGLGVVLVQQRRAAEAVPWLERAVARDPDFVEARLNLAIALDESGHRDRALAEYREVERRAPAGARERAAARTLRQQLEAR